MTTEQDEILMRHALRLAALAREKGEVPVGALLARDGEIIGEGFNQPISTHDPTAHAEILALRQAAQAAANYRLPGTTLYVTIEPCTMCAGALIHARVQRVVFGAREPRAGALVSNFLLADSDAYNHRLEVTGGVLEQECADIIKTFFRERRTA